MILCAMQCPQNHSARPFRAFYCHRSRQMVLRYDHYCSLTGCAIGPKNHLFLIVWLILSVFYLTWTLVIALLATLPLLILLLATLLSLATLYVWSQFSALAKGITLHEKLHRNEPGYEYVGELSDSFSRQHPNQCFPVRALLFVSDPAYQK